MKYTLEDYKADLKISEWIEKNSPDLDYEIIENRIDSGERIILVNDYSDEIDSSKRMELLLQSISNQKSFTFPNILLLRRSSFNLEKFSSLVKIEDFLEDDDEFSAPFILLWTQIENEYKTRFFKNFIPENKSVIFYLLDSYSRRDYAFFKEAINKNYQVTFGLVSVLFSAIEQGIKTGEKNTLEILSNILSSTYAPFFKRWRMSEKLYYINTNIRNPVIHDNKPIDFDLYCYICNELFGQDMINYWCTSKSPGLFGEYLRILPQQ